MPTRISCPLCNANLRVPDGAAGKRMRCPMCKGVVRLRLDAAAYAEESSPLDPVYFTANDTPPPVRRRESTHAETEQEETPTGQPAEGHDRDYHVDIQTPSGTVNSLGIASMAIGGVSFLASMMPCIGYFGIPLSAISMAMGVIGICLAMRQGWRGVVFPVAGLAMGGMGLVIGLRWLLLAHAINTAMAGVGRDNPGGDAVGSPLQGFNLPRDRVVVDWARITDECSLGDLHFKVQNVSVYSNEIQSPILRVPVRITNRSQAKIAKFDEVRVVSLLDEHGNKYDYLGRFHGFADSDRIDPGKSDVRILHFERPADATTQYRLTIDGRKFSLSENIHLAFKRPAERLQR